MILVVCAGNICRSPYVERYLRAGLGGAVEVRSRGTRAVVGEPIAGPMAALMVEEGLDVRDFRAQQLTEEDILRSDLVLAVDRRERAHVARMVASSRSRSFTLRQAARLLPDMPGPGSSSASPGEVVRELAEHLARARGVSKPSQGCADDVVDPWNQPADIYRQAARLLRTAAQDLITALVPAHR